MKDLSRTELLKIYSWFDHVRSTNPAHIEENDKRVAKKIRDMLMKEEQK